MPKTNSIEVLCELSKPFLHLAPEVKIPSVSARLRRDLPQLRFVEFDGRDMRTEPELFATFGATFDPALSPHKENRPNWHAFEDIMRDAADNVPDKDGCVFIIRNAEDCLQAISSGLIAFGSEMGFISSKWATEVREGQWWDRGPKSLHTVFLFNRIPRQLPDAAPIELFRKP